MFLLKTVPCLNDDFTDLMDTGPAAGSPEVDSSGFVDQQSFMSADSAQGISSPASDFFSTAGSKIGSTLVDVLDAYARKKAGLPVTALRNPNYLYNPDGSLMLGPGGQPVLRNKGFSAASIPTWAWALGGLGAVYLLTRRR